MMFIKSYDKLNHSISQLLMISKTFLAVWIDSNCLILNSSLSTTLELSQIPLLPLLLDEC